MEFKEFEKGEFHVVVVRDPLDFFNISEFKKTFVEEIIPKYSHIALELVGNKTDISSSVISALIIAHKKITAMKGSFVLIDIGESTLDLLTVAGLSGFFNIVDSVNQLR